jgi:CHAT domain-containing protein
MRDFVIQFDPGAGNNYPVRLLDRDGTKLTPLGVDGVFAMSDAEVDVLASLLPAQTAPDQLQQEGEKLYQKLSAAVGNGLQNVLDGADVVRLYIEIPANRLHQVPWEIMVWPKSDLVGGATQTWLSQKHQICRVRAPDWAAPRPNPQGPIRILVLVGAAANDKEVQAEGEVEEILRSLQEVHRIVDVDVIWPTDQDKLYSRIKDYLPHVLHFIGHGRNKPAELQFQGWRWSAADVSAHVGSKTLADWKPCLVFLNACRTANASGSSGAMAGAFLGSGAKAVLAMQGNIGGREAGLLAGTFYRDVGMSQSVTEGLLAARVRLASLKKYGQAAFPALTMNIAPATALPEFPALPATYSNRLETCDLLPKLKWFVNQLDSRRKIYRAFWPVTSADKPYSVLVLSGSSGYGKTALSAWAMDLALRVGSAVRYVRLSEDEARTNHVRILSLIWGDGTGEALSPLRDPLPAASVALTALIGDPNSPVDVLYATFREALAEQAKLRPLTIVLDQFGDRMDQGSFWVLWKLLLVPIARGQLKNVKVIVVLNDKELDEFDFETEIKQRDDLRAPYDHLTLPGLKVDEFIELLEQYLYFRSPKFRDLNDYLKVVMPLIRTQESVSPRVAPTQFEHWARYIGQVVPGGI